MTNLYQNATNSTVQFPEYAGYIAASISCIFFGSNLLPVKHYELNDGVFFQWIAGSGVWIVGIIVHLIRGLPHVYALPMLGGVMWAIGNLFIVAIIKTIGLSLGILIWSSFNMLGGWASGRFGWFGLVPQVPMHPVLNYIGVAFAAVSIPIYFIATSLSSPGTASVTVYYALVDESRDRLISEFEEQDIQTDGSPTEPTVEEQEKGFWDFFSPFQKKLIGCSLSIFSGVMYGFNFVPVTYVIDHYEGASKNGLDHVFAHCCGIYFTSTWIFIIYAIILRNHPRGITLQAVFPGIISGAMWSIANAGWMLANTTISEAISFPLITTGPSLIACLWGIFLFKEIKGLRNFLLVASAFTMTITGAILCGLSRPGEHK